MSELSDNATVRLLIADYVAADAAGKLNVVGGGLGVLGLNQETGFTAPFGVVVIIAVPPNLDGAETSVEVILEDSTGAPVGLPGPAGEPQIMRVAQNVTFEEKNLSAVGVPRRALRPRYQWILMFGAGLPLSINQRYLWRVKLDHETRDEWTEEFVVPGPPPGPVLG